jgi:methionine synthase I (cobalamin-dependent)
MHPQIRSLIETGTVVTDGSWGTQLQIRGLKQGLCPDAWNLTHPDRVQDVAAQYVAAGSQIILTNTFGANRILLEKFGLAAEVLAINRNGVHISKAAAGERALVFASIGPSGKLILTGDVTEPELRAAFEEQARALAEAGADGLVIETMMDLTEARLALSAAKQTGLPVIACMVFDSGTTRDRTMMGNTPEEVVTVLAAAGADGLGANCGQGIENFVPLCRRLRAATALPLWMKPNAGLPVVVDGKVVYRTTPAEFVRHVPNLVAAGANFIGGCCGTDQDFIRAICEAL